MAAKIKHEFTINGECLTFDFGMYCWEMFCEKMGVTPENIASAFVGENTFRAMRMMAYCGLAANDWLNDVPEKYSERDVARMINSEPKRMNEIFNAGISIFYSLGEEKPAEKSEGKKKVSRSKKSKK